MTTADALALAVALARTRLQPDPEPGDLVVETSWLVRGPDPGGIGWLVAHGLAPYTEDGTGSARDVWDVTPLTGALGVNGRTYQRWENADFQKVPDSIVRRLRLAPPEGWASDFAPPDAWWRGHTTTGHPPLDGVSARWPRTGTRAA